MTRVISVANQKGGVGKTTTTISLGAALAELGQRVLLVDLDPQGALSVGVGVNAMALDLTVYNLLLDRDARFEDVVCKTSIDGADLLPGNIDLSAAEVVLVSEVGREQALKRAIMPSLAEYDVVLIDCPPSLGLLTINALTASREVVIPLECEFFALRGMALLVDTIEKVQDRLNPELEIEGVIATMYDSRTLHSREVLERVREAFGTKVFKTTIPRTIRFAEAPVAGQPILTYAGDSKGAAAYRALAKEVLHIVEQQESDIAGGGRAVQEHDAADQHGDSAVGGFNDDGATSFEAGANAGIEPGSAGGGGDQPGGDDLVDGGPGPRDDGPGSGDLSPSSSTDGLRIELDADGHARSYAGGDDPGSR